MRPWYGKHITVCMVWRSTADNIIKTYFRGQSTKFSWANTNFNGQNRTFSFSAHAFIVKTRYALANMFSWAKCNIFMGKVRFHGQTELRVACARLACVVKMITGRSCEKSHVYVSYQLRVDNVLPATSLGSSSRVRQQRSYEIHFGGSMVWVVLY